VVFERDRIAESWRTRRWDSLVANGPAWHDRFPNLEFKDLGDDDFATKEQVADYLVAYSQQFNAPIQTGVDVTEIVRNTGKPGFNIEYKNSEGSHTIEADHVVVATGAFQKPVIPSIAPVDEGLKQIHSAQYFSPQQLPEGAVLVVGAGSSGVQIAEELQASGRPVYLSVGAHNRPPRAYRGRDYCWWLGVLGEWEAAAPAPGTEHVTIAVSGANGGYTIDFRELANRGITLLGMTDSFSNGVVKINNDLAKNIRLGDENYLTLLKNADEFVERNGLDLPEEPDAHQLLPDPSCISDPLLQLNLSDADIQSIIWATGYAQDFSWLKVDAFDANGTPAHQRGVSTESGIYFLGLPWLSRRGSSFIWGVWHDALYIANHIKTQRSYLAYHDAARG